MRLTAEIKLLPDAEAASALTRTIAECNQAADWISERAFETGVRSRFGLHRLVYHEARKRFAISAQATCLAVSRVAGAYRRDKTKRHHFRTLGAVSFDSRLLRVRDNSVSIWTVNGRRMTPFVCGDRQRMLIATQTGESDLILRDGKWFLQVGCEVETPELREVDDYLGVDLGIVNIATTSDGQAFAGGHLNGLRHRHRRIRGRLQKKGTRAATRLAKKRARKEARMASHVNHCISKTIVATAERTGRGVALEDLKGIRSRVRARRPQRATLHSWAFAQLGSYVGYKAALAGVPVVYVDPRNTSRTCPACGHVAKANRSTQAKFKCVVCGLAGPADHFAALEIGRRAAVNRPDSTLCASDVNDVSHDVESRVL